MPCARLGHCRLTPLTTINITSKGLAGKGGGAMMAQFKFLQVQCFNVTGVVIVSSVVMIPAAVTCEIYFLPLQASQNGLQ